MTSATGWIDVSVTVRQGMPSWPGDPPIYLERARDMGRGDDCNVSHVAMGVHSGTHMDAPLHFIHGAAGLDTMPLDATMGEARVIDILDPAEVTAVHRILLEAGVWIIEGLDLSQTRAGRYEMVCLPVKIHESDGAPARAILRPLD